MRRDNDGFGFVSRAERRAADAFYAALSGRRPSPRQYGEALDSLMPQPPIIERTWTPSLEPLAEDPTPACGFFGPGGTMRTLDQLRGDIAKVATDQWKEWHAVAVPRLENDVKLFWLLFAYHVSANRKISADQVKALHAAAKPLSFAPLLAPAANIEAEVKKLRDEMLKGTASPPADLKTRVDEAIKGARESHLDTKSGPWSAVFVSAVVRGAAIVKGVEADPTKPLFVSVKHIEYTKEALRRTPEDGRPAVAGTYHAFKPGVREVAVGDIIVQDRRPRLKETGVTTLSLSMDDTRITHGDIVVEVKDDHAVTIGGNVCNSVRFRHYPVKNKCLVVEPNQLFVQENSRGRVPILPAESCHDAGDDLESQSTKRIFALLSLVEECPTAPKGGAKS